MGARADIRHLKKFRPKLPAVMVHDLGRGIIDTHLGGDHVETFPGQCVTFRKDCSM